MSDAFPTLLQLLRRLCLFVSYLNLAIGLKTRKRKCVRERDREREREGKKSLRFALKDNFWHLKRFLFLHLRHRLKMLDT